MESSFETRPEEVPFHPDSAQVTLISRSTPCWLTQKVARDSLRAEHKEFTKGSDKPDPQFWMVT